MSIRNRTRYWRILGLALTALPSAAGHVPLADPVAAQATAPPELADPDYLELPGNVPRALASARQLGPVDAQAPMERMILALRRAPEAEARLARRLADLQDPGSASYHQWLTPEQFGTEFGPAPETLERVTGWLLEKGFRVDDVAAGRMAITFSGTVDQVERAFRTPIRIFELNGHLRQGNLRDPAIPRALADAVEGVVSLHNVPHPAMNRGFRPVPPGAAESGNHDLAPGDFAAIYNLKPLYRDGVDGTGVAIAIVGRTHIPVADITAFRKAFALPAKAPEIIVNGPDPGDLGLDEDGEADLDVEWAGAVARNADIRFVASASTASTDGVDLSAQYIVDHNLAPVMSTSFGQCESQLGAAERAFFRNLWVQAAVQGISSIVASGDSGPAGCDGGGNDSGSGPAVSGLASTPFNLAVGGTQLNEGSGVYWRKLRAPDQSSAIGYIPEQAWNESGSAGGSGLWASGGGPSACYRQACWQIAKGVPCAGQRRCIPDVALTAAGGHDGYLIQTLGMRTTVGGTSCSAPAFAGIMALVVQKTGERQGNPCPALYTLGSAQFKGQGPVVFHDTTDGDTSVPGLKGYPCTPGYDLATGLGSVDASALVGAWKGGLGNNVEAAIQRPGADLTVDSGTPVAFVGTGRDSNPNASLAYAWSYGDGGTAAGASGSHTYRNAAQAPADCLVTFTATDGTGAQGSDTRTVTVLPAPPPGELIVNGGFEYGARGWSAKDVSLGDNGNAEPPHLGKGDAWFSGWQNGTAEVLRQTVRIPAGAASARLTYWLRIDSFGVALVPLDTFQVKARSDAGPLAILDTFSNLDNGQGYQQHSLDLSAYRGRKVELSFVAQDSPLGVNTSFLLDDVSLVAK